MAIRRAGVRDLSSISNLLQQLGYPDTEDFLKRKMIDVLIKSNAVILVYEKNFTVVAFMAIDFIIQLGLKGDFARISYFAVDSEYRSKGIGKEMEEHAVTLALEKKCSRLELHCNESRTGAHRFYEGQGYIESPKYFIKMIDR